MIEAAFAARKVPIVEHEEWTRRTIPGTAVVKGHPFTTLYQTAGRVDFTVFHDGQAEITIEVKHQNVGGSTDEKLPYVLLNGLLQWGTKNGILVLSGDHWSSPRGMTAADSTRKLAARLAPAGQRFEIFDMTAATNWIARNF